MNGIEENAVLKLVETGMRRAFSLPAIICKQEIEKKQNK